MENSYHKRKRLAGLGAAGRKAEKKTAKRYTGRAQPGSGALEGAKGDIDLPEFLVEVKSTEQDSVSVKRLWLSKIGQEARRVGKTPALTLNFVTVDGRPVRDGAWVLIPDWLFQQLLQGDKT